MEKVAIGLVVVGAICLAIGIGEELAKLAVVGVVFLAVGIILRKK